MTAATAPRGTTLSGARVMMLALLVAVAFGAAFAIGKATAGDSGPATGAQPIHLPSSKPKTQAIDAPAALPGLRAEPAPEPSSGGSAPSGGSSGAAPAPTPTPAPAPPSGGGGPIIQG